MQFRTGFLRLSFAVACLCMAAIVLQIAAEKRMDDAVRLLLNMTVISGALYGACRFGCAALDSWFHEMAEGVPPGKRR